jgi:hypothetical protein
MIHDAACQLCRQHDLLEVLNLGLQPISNRFRREADENEARFLMDVVQCAGCGLVQLRDPVPAHELIPPFSWLSYNEPEGHLDRLAELIVARLSVGNGRTVWGLSFKDDTLLRRLSSRGLNTYRLDPARDLDIDWRGAGIESLQQRLEPARVKALIEAHGKPTMIVARHILEHVHDLNGFMRVMRELLAPDGLFVVEVPDCEPSFRQLDYTILWEEHVTYHTKGTLPGVFAMTGLELLQMEVLPLGHESLLVGIGRVAKDGQSWRGPAEIQGEPALMAEFRRRFPAIRARFAEALTAYASEQKKVALLGAGHLACAFVNYLGLAEHIAFAVDDDPNKQGLYLPGTQLVIRGSAALVEDNVRLCLLSVNPEVEQKVIGRRREFADRGGHFASIFTGSARALIKRETT